MGVSYVAVACSLDSLASLYGARDEALFGRVLHSNDPHVLHYLRVACRGGHTAEDVLAEIFRGAALTTFGGHVYAYALLACAYVVGHDLGGFDCAYSRPDKLNTRLDALGEGDPAVPMFLDDWPLPGLTLDDYPGCTTLRADEVVRLAEETRAMVVRVGASFNAEDDAISRELLHWFADCYAGAARRGSDLLLVVH